MMKTPERYRPAFHFTPEANWMNDPNGLVWIGGRYHLFYQYYPDGVVWGPMHWGHATSADLLDWERLPVALSPDRIGWIFSGSAVVDRDNTAGFGAGALVAIFTYHDDTIARQGRYDTESQGIAWSLDGGRSWTKYAGNPVLANSGERDFRDPKVFRNARIGRWNMILAAGDRMKIYSSSNLTDWRHESDFIPRAEGFSGVWECPDLFPMKADDGEKWVLVASQTDNAPNGGSGTRWFTGDFNGREFSNQSDPVWLDYGKDLYAAVTFNDAPDGRRILLGWMSNWQYAAKTPTEGWRGAMTLPRELELIREGGFWRLRQSLAPSWTSALKTVFEAAETKLPFRREGLDLSRTEISFTLEAADLRISLSNASGDTVVIESIDQTVSFDRRKSGNTDFSEDFAPGCQTMPLDGKLRDVRLILDASSVELLVNGGSRSMTNLVFPETPYTVISIEGSPTVKNLMIRSYEGGPCR